MLWPSGGAGRVTPASSAATPYAGEPPHACHGSDQLVCLPVWHCGLGPVQVAYTVTFIADLGRPMYAADLWYLKQFTVPSHM
jgi:hypothetical protein